MASNLLKINDDKTEVLILGTKAQLAKVDIPYIEIGESKIKPSESARNIGAIFSSNMDMKKQVNTLCRSAYHHIRNLRKIRKYLTKDALATLVHAFVTSKLDFLNCLLYGLPHAVINKLQKVQNTAARLVLGTKKFDHVTPMLQELHWLPITFRIQYKVLLMTYNALSGSAPSYIRELLHEKKATRTLRTSGQHLLKQPRTKLVSYGDRAFAASAPKLWNNLPMEIESSPL
jgi:hypothetical protein